MILTFYSAKNMNTVFDTLNVELAQLFNWFKVNKFLLNIYKTNYIIFNSGHGELGGQSNCTANLYN